MKKALKIGIIKCNVPEIKQGQMNHVEKIKISVKK